MTVDELLARLQGARQSGGGWEAHCPGHEDKKRSLTVAVGDSGALLVKCHAGTGCPIDKIVAAISITKADLFPRDGRRAGARDGRRQIVATYDYQDEGGALLFQVVRYDPKGFAQRRPDGNGGFVYKLDGVRRVLYRLPELRAADPSIPVYITEGEKDASALAALGLVATTNPGGAGKWRADYAEALRGRRVVILPDNDDPGQQHAEQVATVLRPVAASVRVVALPGLPDKGDVSDWLAGGGSGEVLEALVGAENDSSAPYREGAAKESEGTPPPPQLRFRTAREICEAGGSTIAWCVERYLAEGAITEVGGKPKAAGKTTLVLSLVRAVLDGAPFLGGATRRSPVVYLSEEGETTFRPALCRAGLAEHDDLKVIFQHETFGVPWGEMVSAAAAEAERLGARVLVTDTFSAFTGLKGDGENAAGEVLEAVRPLRAAAAQHKLAIVLNTHERKSGGDVGDATRGSTALAGAVDVILLLRRLPKAPRETMRVLQALSRFEETPAELVIELTEDRGYVAIGSTEDLNAREAERAILDVLPTDPTAALPIKTISEKVEVKRTVLDKALNTLRAKKQVDRIGKGAKGDPHRYYRLATDPTAEEEF